MYDYHENIQGYTQRIQYSGKIDALEFRAQRLLHRDGQSKTSAQLRVFKQHRSNYLNDTKIAVQNKEVTAGELGMSYRKYYGQTVLDTTLSCRLGVNSQPDVAAIPTTHYKLWTFDLQLGTPVKVGTMQSWYSCRIRAQYTKNVLDTTDFFDIGNRYTVRGFDGKQTLGSESGWSVRNELSIPIKGKEVYIGLDYGQVSGHSASSLVGKSVAGAVVGLRGQLKSIRYDVFTGWPLYKPQKYQTANVCYGFQFNYSI